MRRGAKLAGLIAGGVTFAPLGLAALLASITRLPYGGGLSRPFLTWPLKALAFLVALTIAAAVGALVMLLAKLILRLIGRRQAP